MDNNLLEESLKTKKTSSTSVDIKENPRIIENNIKIHNYLYLIVAIVLISTLTIFSFFAKNISQTIYNFFTNKLTTTLDENKIYLRE